MSFLTGGGGDIDTTNDAASENGSVATENLFRPGEVASHFIAVLARARRRLFTNTPDCPKLCIHALELEMTPNQILLCTLRLVASGYRHAMFIVNKQPMERFAEAAIAVTVRLGLSYLPIDWELVYGSLSTTDALQVNYYWRMALLQYIQWLHEQRVPAFDHDHLLAIFSSAMDKLKAYNGYTFMDNMRVVTDAMELVGAEEAGAITFINALMRIAHIHGLFAH